MTTTVLIRKNSEIKNKLPNHEKYIIKPEFINLIAENFKARLQLILILKKLTSSYKQISSNKPKYLEV